MVSLAELRKRVEAATGPDRELDYALEEFFVGDLFLRYGYKRLPGDNGWDTAEPASIATKLAPAQEFTSSVDYLIGFIGRKLPDHTWGVHCHKDAYRAHVTKRSPLRPMPNIADAATPALALIAATLRAIEQKEARNG